MRRFQRLLSLSALALAIVGCSDPASPSESVPESIEVVAGNAQVGPAGAELSLQLVVRVLDAKGSPVAGVFVLWIGDGTPWVNVTNTASDGITRNYWSLGEETGPQQLELWVFDIETGNRGKFLGYLNATAQP